MIQFSSVSLKDMARFDCMNFYSISSQNVLRHSKKRETLVELNAQDMDS